MRRAAIRHSAGTGSGRSRHSARCGVELAALRGQLPKPRSCATFPALSPGERAYLLDWRRAAKAFGIDAVEDMIERPWPCPVADVILGIFRSGDEQASWLVIGHNGQWVVACCAEGTVSPTVGSLADALSLVQPLPRGFIRSA
jgi:hypothetical protein